jgi:FkbM family methyltransferase
MAWFGKQRERPGQLVFDLGFHRGEDTAYYLALGCRVLAVEANPALAEAGRTRFASAIAAGSLTLLAAAVVGRPQRRTQPRIAFYPHPLHSEWGSVDARRVERNARVHGQAHRGAIEVETISLEELVATAGVPDYLKIDLEGADGAVLADLELLSQRPRTVSWETGKESLASVLQQHRHLATLGYRRFRVVQQEYLDQATPVRCPDGSEWRFLPGCSGPLPDLSPVPWRGLTWVEWEYRLRFAAYRLVGPGSKFRALGQARQQWVAVVPRRLQAWAARRRLPLPGWVDSHATLEGR